MEKLKLLFLPVLTLLALLVCAGAVLHMVQAGSPNLLHLAGVATMGVLAGLRVRKDWGRVWYPLFFD